jgi:ABC-2 type transport system permease protein
LQIGLGLARYVFRSTFRNKVGYFFSLIFPLTLVLVFGLVGSTPSSLKLGVDSSLSGTQPAMQAVEAAVEASHGGIELVRADAMSLRQRLRTGVLAGILTPGGENGQSLMLMTSGVAPQAGATAAGFLRSVLAELSLQEAGISQPAYPVEVREMPGRAIRHFDFILPGQIGFSILSLATFGMAYSLSTLRKTLVLKRMLATELQPLTLVVAQGLSRSVQAVFQTLILLAVAILAFKFTPAHGWITVLEMLVLSFLGILSFLGFGILMTNLADDENTLPVTLNLFNLPQMLLAGVFFPIDGMPGWVQAIGNNLPLAYLNTSLRKASLDGVGLLELWPYLLGMFAWAAVSYVLAARTFRTE